jgi:hypothetical protein
VTRAGDFIDESVGRSLDIPSSVIQLEKEAGVDLMKPDNSIIEAVTVYYNSVISYTLRNISFELEKRKSELPRFSKPVPIVVSGGLTKAKGFEIKVEQILNEIDFPIKVGKILKAEDPMTAVATGCCLASQL